MYLRGIAIFFLAIAQHSLCYGEMDAIEDPIRKFLQLDADSPLEHELVEIKFSKRLHKRAFSGRTMPAGVRMRIRAFGVNVNLWLHPKDPATLATDETPVYYCKYSPSRPGNVNIVQQHGLMRELGEFFEDPEHLASLIIGKDDYGRTTVNGQIGSRKLAVRSLPENVVNEYARNRRSIDDLDDDFSNSTRHVVYRINDDFEKKYSLGAFNETILRERVARSTSGIPYGLNPKILLIVDYSMYKAQGHDIYRFLEYLLAFSNGMDLKYRGLETPRVRLHISGIIIGVDPKAIPYISINMLDDNAFEATQAMVDSTTFFYQIKDTIPLKAYDIALTITRLVFGLGKAASIIGKSYLAAACVDDTYYERMISAAITRDNGAFSGIITGAHELGHVLGMNDDVLQSDDCWYTNGFVMSLTPKYTKNSTSFSSCSVKELQQRLDEQDLECLYDVPRAKGRKLPKLMPGRLCELDEQCAARGMGLPCNVSNVDICVNFYCLDGNGNCKGTRVAALEGTRCSDGNQKLERFCVHNECVHV